MGVYGLSELHVHLDGSLRAETLNDLLHKKNKGYASLRELEDALCFKKGMDLPRCLNSFETSLSVLQTTDALERVASELVQDLSSDGVAYAEIRYCPALHTREGLKPEDVVRSVYNGLQKGLQKDADESKDPIITRQIVTILRSSGERHGWEMVELAEHSKQYGVVGIDLAGNEYAFPPEIFADVFCYARDVGLRRTVHAGEGESAQAAKNIETAITQLHAERIGHGTAMKDYPHLMDLARKKNVAIEVCPTSNIHTGSVRGYSEHPAPIFHDAGLVIVPCADNTLFSKTTTSQEYRHLSRFFPKLELENIKRKARDVRFL